MSLMFVKTLSAVLFFGEEVTHWLSSGTFVLWTLIDGLNNALNNMGFYLIGLHLILWVLAYELYETKLKSSTTVSPLMKALELAQEPVQIEGYAISGP